VQPAGDERDRPREGVRNMRQDVEQSSMSAATEERQPVTGELILNYVICLPGLALRTSQRRHHSTAMG
jgi:hypothetical protein